MNRKVFFDFARNAPFGGRISSDQMDGLNRILDYKEQKYPDLDVRWLAYLLATTYHETAHTMQPVRENDNKAKTYLRSKKYYPWYGRGLVQITWEKNYKKYGITKPDDALQWPTALHVLFDGSINGKYTGKRLGDYFNKSVDNPKGARKIINGTDKDSLIAVYHQNFLDALKQAEKAVEAPEEVREPASKADVPDAAPAPSKDPLTQAVTGIAGTGIVTSVISAVSNPWALAAVVVILVGLGVYLWQRKKLSNAHGV